VKNINSKIFNIVLSNDQSNIDIFKGDEFDFIIKSNQITADTISSVIENNTVLHLFTNTDSHTEILMIIISENSNYIGKNPNEISLPINSKIIAVINSSGNINYDYSTDLRVLDKILIQIPLKHEKTEMNFLNEKRN
jgi:Trk K+ transport system NAD-binding subunit